MISKKRHYAVESENQYGETVNFPLCDTKAGRLLMTTKRNSVECKKCLFILKKEGEE